jgi:sec-independent protein translocase protein TatC
MTDTLPAPSLDTSDRDMGRMSLMEHLVELRGRIVKCAIAIAIGSVIGWLLYFQVLHLLAEPLRGLSGNSGEHVSPRFLSTQPLEVFLFRLKMSAYLGVVIVMPYLLWQLWRFIAPGLYQNERRYAVSFVVSATLLFLLGAAIAFFTLAPALKFLQSMGGGQVDFKYTIDNYVMLIVYMMLAFGAGFQFPILLVFLQIVGVLTPQKLSQFRRFAIVLIFVVAAVITPSADPISLFALAIPMCLFYEISIIIGRVMKRRRLKAEARAAAG